MSYEDLKTLGISVNSIEKSAYKMFEILVVRYILWL
jgi:hypothetical protein